MKIFYKYGTIISQKQTYNGLRTTITTLLLVLCLSIINISNVVAQSKNISLNFVNTPVSEILNSIEQQSDFSFFYTDELDLTQQISVKAQNESLNAVLTKIFTNNSIQYKITDKRIILYKNELKQDATLHRALPEKTATNNQLNTILGKVVDADGQTVPGASVMIKGTKTGTTTDMDGKFSIPVPSSNSVLQISFVGFTTAETRVGGQKNITITLENDAISLDEIIVTGVAAGTPKQKLGFSIEKLTSKKLEQVPADNAASALQGKMAGVKITRSSGEPGSSFDIQLRAAKSITGGSAPLIIVDGILGGDMNISADDIASIEVLKGAAASSLYGSRAANGVISIMTKRGSSITAGKIQVDFRSEFGKSYLGFMPKRSSASNRLIENGDATLITDPDQIYNNVYPKTFDHVKQFFNPGTYWTNYIALKGNSSDNKVSVYTSLQTTKEEGIVKLVDGSNRTNVKLNLDYKINSKLTFKTSNFYSLFDSDNVDPSIFGTLLRSDPNADLLLPNEDGTEYLVNVNKIGDRVINPLYVVKNTRNERKNQTLQSYFGFKYDLLSNLSFDASYSTIRSNGSSFYMQPKGMLAYDLTEGIGYISRGMWDQTDQTVTLESSFSEKFGDFNTRAKAQFLYESMNSNNLSGSASDLALGGYDLTTTGAGSKPGVGSSTIKTNAYNYSLIAAVDYKDKYIVDALIRRDASSLFGPDVRWQTFYRVSGAWRISQDFKINGIDEWKIRSSYGIAGLRPPYGAIYETFSLSEGATGSMETLGNKKLKPSFSKEFEVGMDISFLGRFTFDVNYSLTLNTDLILKVPVSPLSGAAYKWSNAAELKTHTYEASLNANVLKTQDWALDVGFTFDKYKQKITKLNAKPYFVDGTRFRIEEGIDFGTLYLEQFARSLDEVKNQVPNGRSLDEMFVINNQGFVVERSKVGTVGETPVKIKNDKGAPVSKPLANCTPDFNVNFNTTLTYKNFTFYMLWSWQQGGDVYNHSVRYTTEPGLFDQSGKAPNEQKSGTYYGNGGQESGLIGWDNNVLVFDGTFLKLREVSLGYNFKVDSWKFIKNIRLNLIGRNLLTITKYPGFDPEIGQNKTDKDGKLQVDSNNFRFDSNDRYPTSRLISGSIALTF